MFFKSIYPRKPNYSFRLIRSLIVLGIVSIPMAIANAETEINTTVLFQPPSEEEQPENTEGAASRGNKVCSQDSPVSSQQMQNRINLTAVVPNNNYGLTLKERPIFWVYLPPTSAKQVILTVKEEESKPHWQQSVNLTEEVGIMGIKLSDDAPILEVGKNYQWVVILVCNDRPHPNDPVVTSWIKRIDTQVSEGSPTELEKAANYARQGIWYDALNILVTETSIDNWQNIWLEYLHSGGLDEVANEPIIETIR